MKQLFLTLAVALPVYCSYAQTNTFPSSGNVGIGTTSPGYPLDVNGTGHVNGTLTLSSTGTLIDGTGSSTAFKYITFGNGTVNTLWAVEGTSPSFGNANDVDFGTQQNAALRFVANNAVQMSVLGNGNVGIGTTSPTQRLTIPITSNANGISLGTYSSLSAGSFAFVGITGADGTFNSGNLTGSDNGSTGMAIIHTSGGAGNSAELAFVTHNNGVDSRERVRIDRLGNVGIGTTSPGTQLDIQGNGTNALPLYLRAGTNLGTAGQTVALQFRESTGATPTGAITNITQDGTHIGLAFSTYNSGIAEVMRILGNGNVGIGTTTPDQLLSVAGTIHSKEVKVDLIGWPDYVFKPKYHLPSLTEIKSYIDKNRHLPDMPSEQEVKDNGINLGEIVKVQTKKIEELTLYAIEQQKQIEQLKQKNTQLQSQQEQINQLKEQLASLTKALTKN